VPTDTTDTTNEATGTTEQSNERPDEEFCAAMAEAFRQLHEHLFTVADQKRVERIARRMSRAFYGHNVADITMAIAYQMARMTVMMRDAGVENAELMPNVAGSYACRIVASHDHERALH
jgi:hypothetical protein